MGIQRDLKRKSYERDLERKSREDHHFLVVTLSQSWTCSFSSYAPLVPAFTGFGCAPIFEPMQEAIAKTG